MSEPLTRLAHRLVRPALGARGRAVDATAGNGHDTAFLAERLGAAGTVLAIDVQQAALARTRQRLREAGLDARVALAQADHRQLGRLTTPAWRGSVDAVMLNLGYLPGSDRSVTTTPEQTRAALDAAGELLRPGGVLSVLAYRGHTGGTEEARAVTAWMARTAQGGAEWRERAAASERGPVLHVLRYPAGPRTAAATADREEGVPWPS
ncbi:MAG: tRNA (mnm(5)s(2)U34)-methyltransferase [Halorhodospira sp.]